MNTSVATFLANQNWKELYKAALFEADGRKLPERITHAQCALAMRARELFYTDKEHFQERFAIDAAISALQSLRSTNTTGSEGRTGMHRARAA